VALSVITWLWGTKYGPPDVYRLARRLRECLTTPHEFVAFSDKEFDGQNLVDVRPIWEADRHLIDRSCFVRLRMFDPVWQRDNGFTERIVSLDLDNVIVSNLDPLFVSRESFMILRKVNAVNPNPFNASVMALEPGAHSNIWQDFSTERARYVPFHEFPDDQGWIHSKLPNANGWNAGRDSGIYGFKKPGWPHGSTNLPHKAKIVAFIGHRKPEHYPGLSWIKRYWTEA
jgi:hypothetical protein